MQNNVTSVQFLLQIWEDVWDPKPGILFVFNLVLTCAYHDCELTIQG